MSGGTNRDASRKQPQTRAAGGVLWRREGKATLVAIVHRPRYDDWSLPKGKLSSSEHPLLGGIREVLEETGSQVIPGRKLMSVSYPLGDVDKQVSYWSMKHLRGEHQPSREVDRISWLTIAEASRKLSYPMDRAVLADFARMPAETTTLLLMRHAKAGKRAQWSGEDRLRPLDKFGRSQARDAVPLLMAFDPQRIMSADRVRCEQTVTPLATALDLPISIEAAFSDEAYLEDPQPALRILRGLAQAPGTSVLCSQGKAIPAILKDLGVPDSPDSARKGSVWALSCVDGELISSAYYSRAA